MLKWNLKALWEMLCCCLAEKYGDMCFLFIYFFSEQTIRTCIVASTAYLAFKGYLEWDKIDWEFTGAIWKTTANRKLQSIFALLDGKHNSVFFSKFLFKQEWARQCRWEMLRTVSLCVKCLAWQPHQFWRVLSGAHLFDSATVYKFEQSYMYRENWLNWENLVP